MQNETNIETQVNIVLKIALILFVLVATIVLIRWSENGRYVCVNNSIDKVMDTRTGDFSKR